MVEENLFEMMCPRKASFSNFLKRAQAPPSSPSQTMFMKCLLFKLNLLGLLAIFLSVIDAQCTDVHVVFARGSGELPGLGICGTPLVSDIKSNLPGKSVSSYAVNYLADLAQTSAGPGATDMTRHIVSYAAQCPDSVFVIGGYSQGGSVTDIAIGIKTTLGVGQTIPTELAPRIKAVVVFGNPLKLFMKTIKTASPLYGPKALEFCNFGDPVCAAGVNGMAHLTYPTDGSVRKAAQQAAALVLADETRSIEDSTNEDSDIGANNQNMTLSDSTPDLSAVDGAATMSKLKSLISGLYSRGNTALSSRSENIGFNPPSFGFDSLLLGNHEE